MLSTEFEKKNCTFSEEKVYRIYAYSGKPMRVKYEFPRSNCKELYSRD